MRSFEQCNDLPTEQLLPLLRPRYCLKRLDLSEVRQSQSGPLGYSVIGMFPLVPVLLGLVVGLGVPFGIVYTILKTNGSDFSQYFQGNDSPGQTSQAPYHCLRCHGDMWEPVGVCPACGYGSDTMVCGCGTQVREPYAGAFESTGVQCPNCQSVLKK